MSENKHDDDKVVEPELAAANSLEVKNNSLSEATTTNS